MAVGEGTVQLWGQLGAVDVAAQSLQRCQGLHLQGTGLVRPPEAENNPLLHQLRGQGQAHLHPRQLLTVGDQLLLSQEQHAVNAAWRHTLWEAGENHRGKPHTKPSGHPQ